jgi:hypothetical protein
MTVQLEIPAAQSLFGFRRAAWDVWCGTPACAPTRAGGLARSWLGAAAVTVTQLVQLTVPQTRP